MIYKGALTKTSCPLRAAMNNVDDIDILPVEEYEGTIPEEWTENWLLKNLGMNPIDGNVIDMYRLERERDDEEDLLLCVQADEGVDRCRKIPCLEVGF